MKFELLNYCEIDKYASNSYSLIHNEDKNKNLGDITKIEIEKLPKCDMITHASPCQDYSIMGYMKGADENSGTRSSLMWNSIQVIEHCKPKFVIWENVKNVLSKNMKPNFEKYLDKMDSLGYNNYYEVLNSKDYNVPQNRERIFLISIKKDIDVGYSFPQKVELERSIKDILEDKIDDKYYFGEDIFDLAKERYKKFRNKDLVLTEDYTVCEYRVDEGVRLYKDNICGTLRTNQYCGYKYIIENKEKIRAMTPLECWKLMGFKKEDIEKVEADYSLAQLYKQAGNSISVEVLTSIFTELFKKYPLYIDNLKLISLFSGIGAFERGLENVEINPSQKT